jgi:protein SCO1/2
MSMAMRRLICLGLAMGVWLMPGCGSSESDSREYALQGQILSVTADRKEANVKHDEIKGFMPAMTMPYKVREAKEFESVMPGDLISATLVVLSNDAYLKNVKKTGTSPLEKAPEEVKEVATSGFELLKDGQPVPTSPFIDQDGRKIDFRRAFEGKAVALTFTYTACPMPTFCPLMDRNFVAMQEKLEADPAFRGHLVTVSIDPENDKPAVLKKHAAKLGANPKTWTFLTGNRDDIDQFAARLGLSTTRAMTDPRDITHNLRTAIIDRQGNLVKVFTGNEWTPDQVLADMKVLVGVD